MKNKLKEIILQTLEETLSNNHKEYLCVTHASSNYSGDVKAVIDKKEYSVAKDAAAVDSASSTRAYNDPICGSQQYLLVVYWLIT